MSVRNTYLVCAVVHVALAILFFALGTPVAGGLCLGSLLYLRFTYRWAKRRERTLDEHHAEVIRKLTERSA